MAQKPRYKRCLLGLVVKLLVFDAGEPGMNPGRSICNLLQIHINTYFTIIFIFVATFKLSNLLSVAAASCKSCRFNADMHLLH